VHDERRHTGPARQEDRPLGATALAGLRVAIGLGAAVAPRMVLRPWVGPRLAGEKAAPMLGRSLGGRDLALALGALIALKEEGPARGWVEAGALADASDAIGMLSPSGTCPSGPGGRSSS